MKKTFLFILFTIATLLTPNFSALAATVEKEDVFLDELEGWEISPNCTAYVTKRTYFYSDPNMTEIYGMLKKGSEIKILEELDGYVKINYAEKEGVISASDVYGAPLYWKEELEDGITSYHQYRSWPETIYPSSHFFNTLDSNAHDTLSLFLLDEEDNDFVYITDGAEVLLRAYILNNAYSMGIEDVYICYTTDGGVSADFIINIPTREIDPTEVIDLSFTCEKERIYFKGDFGIDVRLGIRTDNAITIAGEEQQTTKDENGYKWVVATGQNEICYSLIKETKPASDGASVNNIALAERDNTATYLLLTGICIIVVLFIGVGVKHLAKPKKYKRKR